MLALFLPLFLVLLLIGVPVFFAMLVAPGAMLFAAGQERDVALMYRNIYNGIDNGVLLAIPFFMLAGELMNRGGITERLVSFSPSHHRRRARRARAGEHPVLHAVRRHVGLGRRGHLRARLHAHPGHGEGGLHPPLRRRDHGRLLRHRADHPAQSGIMIIYAYVMEVSVAALFAGGIVPGLLVGLGLMGVTRLVANRYEFPPAERQTLAVDISWVENWAARLIVRLAIVGRSSGSLLPSRSWMPSTPLRRSS